MNSGVKKGLKIGGWALGALVALVVLVTLVAAPVAKGYVNSHGEELVGRKVHVEGLRLNVYTGHVAVHGLTLYEENGTETFASFDTLDVGIKLLKLLGHTVHLKHITLSGLKVNLIQQGEQFNFQSIIDHFASDTTEQEEDTTPSDWVLKFYNIRLSHAAVDYHDVANAKQWSLPDVNLRVPGFVLGGEEQSEGGLNIGFAEGGRLSIDGYFDSHRNAYQLVAQLEDFALKNIQPLAADFVRLDRIGGTLQAALKAEGDIGEILKSHIGGSLALKGVDLTANGNSVASLERLLVEVNNINLDANSFDIHTVELQGLTAKYEQWADHNTLDNILLSASSPSADTAEADATAEATDTKGATTESTSKPVKLHVGALKVSGCNLTYSDYTLPDPFHFPLTNLSVEATDLTLAGGNNAKLRASLPGGGHLMVNWKGDLADWKRQQQLFLSIKGLDMKQLSPWTVAYTGQPVEDGIFGLTTRLTIDNSQLDNDNKIDIYKARVGSRRSDVEPEMRIPLKTALYILKDKNDKILIDLPVKGNVDSPEFNYMKLVWKTLGNLLVKVATSPLRAVGNAMGLANSEMDFIAIPPEQRGLTSEQYHILSDLASMMESDSLLVVTLEQRMPEAENDTVAHRYDMRNTMVLRYMAERGVKESQLVVRTGDPVAAGERTGYSIASEIKLED